MELFGSIGGERLPPPVATAAGAGAGTGAGAGDITAAN